jgi:SAM-dependent methyltransferase
MATREAYWEGRLGERFSLEGVGFMGLGSAYNAQMYEVRRALFLRRVQPLVRSWANRDILDVGSGTGFYVGVWKQLGVRSVTGSDITETAVRRLAQRFPRDEFLRCDIGGDVDFGSRTFDAISACDVLFHIVDDYRYRRAFANLRSLLRPGGWLIFTENFLHGPRIRSPTQVSRSLAEIENIVRSAGLEPLERRPAFVLMTTPVDSHSRLHRAWWAALSRVVAAHERLGELAGRALKPFEIALASRLSEGPTTEMMICRRPATDH